MGNCCSAAKCRRAIKQNKKEREARLKVVRDKLTEYGQSEAEREQIHELSLIELIRTLHWGRFSATQVLYAYAHYALEAHERLNCIAEFLLEAFQEAEDLDAKYANSGEKKPPLFGLPFSVKSNMFVKGYDSCIGNARWLGNPSTCDCTLVAQLRLLGAIPFCLTNVPQALASFACSNPVYGRTKHPEDPDRTPGGTAGGEAALLAAGGSAFGIGDDIDGSLRIPAHFCGLTTLKPGQNRFEIEYAHSRIPGNGRLGRGTGVITKSVEELSLLLSYLLGNPHYHHDLVPKSSPLPFDIGKLRDFEMKAKNGELRIGYCVHDGFLKPVPACSNVVLECALEMCALGNKAVMFTIPEPLKAASLFFKNSMPDGGAYLRNIFAQNPVNNDMLALYYGLHNLYWRRILPGLCCFDWIGIPNAILGRSHVRSVSEVRKMHAALDEYVSKFVARWKEAELDALIVPAFPVPAVPHRWPSHLRSCTFSTGLYNMLDFPAGIVPCGTVSMLDDALLAVERKKGHSRCMTFYDMAKAAAKSVGLPVGVQVVTLRWEEEKCLGLMKVLEEVMKTKENVLEVMKTKECLRKTKSV